MGVSVKICNYSGLLVIRIAVNRIPTKCGKIMSQLHNPLFPPGDLDHDRITEATKRAI
jgi:hypothetical protein